VARPLDHRVARAAAIHGAASLLPIPLLDEWIAARARRDVVEAVLREEGRARPVQELAPLYEDQGTFLQGCLMLPVKLILIPIKKILRTIFFVLAIRAVSLEVAYVLHFARAIERCLERGLFPDDQPLPVVREQAGRVRVAFERSFAGVDLLALRHALGWIVRPRRVEQVLEEKQRQGYFDAFDARFDRALEIVTPPA
jgi:hypothetical protein